MIFNLGTITILLITITSFVQNAQAQTNINLYPQYSWNFLEFQYPSEALRQSAISNRQYIKGNSFPIDIDVYYGAYETLQFVTMPRFFDGTPITLGTITGVNGGGGPLIAPFPDYGWHQSGNCNGFTNVFRVFVDECERLWVLDSGVINDKQVCPAKLVLFNLKTGYPYQSFTHQFSNSLNRNMSLFITPIVDSRNCYDSMVYIADVTGFGIIVYDYKANKSWRVESQSDHLKAIPQYSKFTIAGESFDLMDGLFGMAVSPRSYNDRQLFFHALASYTESRIPLSLLDNPSYWPYQNPILNPNQFVKMGARQSTQTTAQAMDYNGNLFFGVVNPPAIGCWDSRTSYNNANLRLVSRNDATLQFVSGLKIVTGRDKQPQLWVLSCRFQKIMNSNRNVNEINYRVQAISINELLRGSKWCNGQPFPY